MMMKMMGFSGVAAVAKSDLFDDVDMAFQHGKGPSSAARSVPFDGLSRQHRPYRK